MVPAPRGGGGGWFETPALPAAAVPVAMKSLTAGSSLPKKSEEVTAMCWTEATGESFNVRAVTREAPGQEWACAAGRHKSTGR